MREAVEEINQGVKHLELAIQHVGPGRVSLIRYWVQHLRSDVKTLLLLAMGDSSGV